MLDRRRKDGHAGRERAGRWRRVHLVAGSRWWLILLPAIVVGSIELLSDTLLDPLLPFPWDAALVAVAVLVFSGIYAHFTFDRMRALGTTLNRQNEELELRIAAARALHRISVATMTPGGLDEVLSEVVDQVRALLSADVSLLLLTGPDGELVLRASSADPGVVDPLGSGPGPDALRFITPEYAHVQLAAPLRRGGSTVGLLFVGCRTSRAFGVGDVETLASLAEPGSHRHRERPARSRAPRASRSAHERERIAREMHDGLAQVLGYVNTKSQAVEGLLGRVGRLDEAQSPAGRAHRGGALDLRRRSRGHHRAHRSPIGPEVELAGEMRDHANRFAEHRKFAVVGPSASAASEAARLSPDTRDAGVPASSSEALTNVRKHAAAHRVTISARRPRRTARRQRSTTTGAGGRSARPRDPGPGPALAALRSRDHARRAAAIGGDRLAERAAASGGMRSTLVVPLDAARTVSRVGARPVTDDAMRILIVDDHALFRDGVASLLDAWGHEVVGLARHARTRRSPWPATAATRPGPHGHPDGRRLRPRRRPRGSRPPNRRSPSSC